MYIYKIVHGTVKSWKDYVTILWFGVRGSWGVGSHRIMESVRLSPL